jgi:hypothetical protein
MGGLCAFVALLALAAGPPEDPWPVPEVRVIPVGEAQRPIAKEVSERAPRLFRKVSRRLDLRSPSPVTILVAARRPTTVEASRRLGLSRVPRWAAGVADGERRRIVLFRNHLGGYPHRDLDGLIAHEASHLILHAALPRGQDVPRWFDEGLAMVVERDLSVHDAFQLARLSLLSGPFPLEAIADSWPGDGASARLAYAQSFGLVAFADELAGPGSPRRLVSAMRRGQAFDRAFERAYGVRPAILDRLWRERLTDRVWRIPLYVLGGLLNAAMGLLAVVAVVKVRRVRRKRLAEMEAREALAAPPGPVTSDPDVWHDR